MIPIRLLQKQEATQRLSIQPPIPSHLQTEEHGLVYEDLIDTRYSYMNCFFYPVTYSITHTFAVYIV